MKSSGSMLPLDIHGNVWTIRVGDRCMVQIQNADVHASTNEDPLSGVYPKQI